MDAQEPHRARNRLFYIGILVCPVYLINTVWCQKRTRTALRMSQNCENLDLGCLSEAPVGAPRMYFYQRIWVPSSKKLNDFNARSLHHIGRENQPFCPKQVTEFRDYRRAFSHSSQ